MHAISDMQNTHLFSREIVSGKKDEPKSQCESFYMLGGT